MSSSQPNPLGFEPPQHWHAKEVGDVMLQLGTRHSGLSEAEVVQRLGEYGPNQFTETSQGGVFTSVFEQVRSPLAIVLVLAFLVTLALQEFIDAGVIAFALLIAITVGVLQEEKASRAFDLLAKSQVKLATVIRGGKKHQIEASKVVPGDIVSLIDGGYVPADIRLISTKKLSVNEAAMTGEWLAVKKQTEPVAVGAPFAERDSMVWMGTYVSEGSGTGVVVATGDSTAVGRLAGDVQSVVDVDTPLQLEMARVSRMMLIVITVLVFLIFVIGIAQGQTFTDMLLTAIAIAVASVPEGLPAAVTIILAVGMEALLKRGGLVRNLLAAETLGSTTFVLTDKTGTLTQAKMAVAGLIHAEHTYTKSGTVFDDDIVSRDLFDTALCATAAYIDELPEEKKSEVRGDPVERAMLETAGAIGIEPEGDTARGRRIDYLGFTSDNRFAAGLTPYGAQHRLCINGVPELLLESATHVRTAAGVQAITDEYRQRFMEEIEVATKEGKRLVAVGYKMVDYLDIPESTEGMLDGLVFLGVVVFADPIRPGVGEAISGVRNAGARVVLITGDNPETALSIARSVGIASADSVAIEGHELEKMSDPEVLDVLRNVTVFARVLPRQKKRLAEILQQAGEVVAMTGDGINDAPALRKANIGVAIGSGTEVAKEASDLVLVNDTFATIEAAIEEGRRIIGNLRKIVGYLLSTSLSEVVLIGTALLVGAPPPILPAQILWANIIEEGLMSVAFAFEKGEPNAMLRRPQDIRKEGILSKKMIGFIGFVILILSSLTVVMYFLVRAQGLPLEELRSVMFLAIAMDSLFIAFAFRSLNVPLWRVPIKSNMFFFGSFFISVILLGIALTIPFMQTLLSYEPVHWGYFVLAVSFSALALLTVEFAKWIFFSRREAIT